MHSLCVSLQGLALFRGGVLMVSHDQHLIESTVDELWAVEQGTGVAAAADIVLFEKRSKAGMHGGVRTTAPHTRTISTVMYQSPCVDACIFGTLPTTASSRKSRSRGAARAAPVGPLPD